MRPRQDIDWGRFLFCFRVDVFRRRHLAANGEGAHCSTRTVAREARVPRRTVRRLLDCQAPWAFQGCKYETFERLCVWMETRPARFLKLAPTRRTSLPDMSAEREALLARYPGVL